MQITETCFGSRYFSCKKARLTGKKNFRPASVFALFSVEAQMFHTTSRTEFNFLASSMCKSSLDVILLLFSAEHIHCWSARWGTLSVNAFEFWHARSMSFRSSTALTWSARLHHKPMWNASFLSVGCSILDDEALYNHVSPDESLSKTQPESAERNSCPQ